MNSTTSALQQAARLQTAANRFQFLSATAAQRAMEQVQARAATKTA